MPIWKKEFFAGGAVWIGDQAGRIGTWEEGAADAAPAHDRIADDGGAAAGSGPARR